MTKLDAEPCSFCEKTFPGSACLGPNEATYCRRQEQFAADFAEIDRLQSGVPMSLGEDDPCPTCRGALVVCDCGVDTDEPEHLMCLGCGNDPDLCDCEPKTLDETERVTDLDRLKAWAKTRGLEVTCSSGTQREPENVVAINRPGHGYANLLARTSLDSIESAAGYVVNTLEMLGVEVEG